MTRQPSAALGGLGGPQGRDREQGDASRVAGRDAVTAAAAGRVGGESCPPFGLALSS
ncbi:MULTISPECIES: hypothetical protein [unclassified Streptomyces]|uniref:hypothetical protein n=1 Tax=unclassified Streptomyces TaxID=2593676 RepID=UPI0015CEF8EF|nr:MULTISPECIES: hypothetical protein [unclassified Streptomyces]